RFDARHRAPGVARGPAQASSKGHRQGARRSGSSRAAAHHQSMITAVLGGGQLARMLALAGAPLGMRTRCLDPSPAAVAGHVSELIVADYDDPNALRQLAEGADVCTFEFENV